MAEKCHHHKCDQHNGGKLKIYKLIFAGILIVLFTVLLVVLIIWAVLQPKKPRFVIQDATLFTLNATVPNVVTTTLQITVLSRNPNDKIGVYYDKLDAYATYHNQQITLYTTIPPTYQGHEEVIIWSPFLCGIEVPVAPYNRFALCQDQLNGEVMLVIKLHGRVRFKVGSYTSGQYRLYIKCRAEIPFGSHDMGIVVGNAIKYQLQQGCSVSI